MKFKVTQKHINSAKQYDPYCCPVALAIKEAFDIDPDADQTWPLYITVTDCIELHGGGSLIRRYKKSKKLVDYVRKFDAQGKKGVKPTTFQFEKEE